MQIPSAPLPQNVRLLLRAWHSAAFGAYTSWSVFEKRASSTELHLRQVRWDRPADYERLTQPLVGLSNGFHPNPIIEVRDRSISREEFNGHMQRGQSLVVPLIRTDHRIVIDGGLFGLHEPGRLTFEWKVASPELDTFMRDLIEFLNACAGTAHPEQSNMTSRADPRDRGTA